MPFPTGITPKTVTVGIASFTDGSLASGTVTITAPVNLIHTPTNRPIFSSSMTQPFVDGQATFTLIPTDAPGLNRQDWTFKCNVNVSGALVQPDPIWFTLPTAGPDTIDLDGLVTVPSSAGVPISVDVLTINDITNSTSDVSVALRAAFGSPPLRRRDIAGAMPTMMTSPPTMTLGANGGASGIAGGVLVRCENRSAFRYLGIDPKYGANYPLGLYYQAGLTYSKSTAPPWAVEYDLDSVAGKFEVLTRGSGGQIRAMVNGQFATVGPSVALPNDGGLYPWTVDFGAAFAGTVRLEFTGSTYFGGIRVGATDSVVAGRKRPRCIVVGDSFTEPTIVDSGTPFLGCGWVQVLGYLTGWDVWACGSGGTGYLNPSTGGKVKFRDRLATDVLPFLPDVVLLAGGTNDRAYAGVTYEALNAEVTACITQLKAATPAPYVGVVGPFWSHGPQTQAQNIIRWRDAIAAAASAANAPFVDTMQSTPPITWTSSLAAGAAINATSISVPTTLPARPDGSFNYWVQIGTDINAEIRLITGQSGAGPYTLNFGGTGGLFQAHPASDPVQVVGPSALTGTGRQGTTTGDGNADRVIGSDGTHPTGYGHIFWGKSVAELLSRALPTP